MFFLEVLRDLVGINFRNCGTSIDSWSSPGRRQRCFRRRQRAVWMISVSREAATGALVAILLTYKNKRKLRNFDQPLGLPGHRRRCVWRRQHAVWAISRSRRQPPLANKRKLRNFDRPLGLPGHRRRFFYIGNVSYRRKMTVWLRDNCRCCQSWSMSPPSPFRNFTENSQLCTFFLPSILCNSI